MNQREYLEQAIAATEREAYVAARNEEPLHEQELLAKLESLREDLADLDAEEADAEAAEESNER